MSGKLVGFVPKPVAEYSGQTKVCALCKIEQPVENFYWYNKAKGYRHSRCKECRWEEHVTNWLYNGPSIKKRRIQKRQQVV